MVLLSKSNRRERERERGSDINGQSQNDTSSQSNTPPATIMAQQVLGSCGGLIKVWLSLAPKYIDVDFKPKAA